MFPSTPWVPRRRRNLAFSVLLLCAPGCAPPDRPSRVPEDTSDSVLESLGAEIVQSVVISEGVRYRRLTSPAGPWAIHLLEVDLNRCEIALAVLPAQSVTGEQMSLATVSDMASATDVLAAVNGDFFLAEGITVGPEVVRGELRRSMARPSFFWDPERGPWVGVTNRNPDGTLTAAGRRLGAIASIGELLGGYPELLDRGEPVRYEYLDPGFSDDRHPRTAVAFDERSGRLWLVVVDGRRASYSDGMALGELRDLLKKLGATEALNLDGGGSSTMVVRNRVVNRPSDPVGERPVANALGVRHDRARCEII